jgi:hypothetical protein
LCRSRSKRDARRYRHVFNVTYKSRRESKQKISVIREIRGKRLRGAQRDA